MKTALLVIDAQKVYTDPDSELCCQDRKQTIKRINKLIDRFKEQSLPIVFVRHIHKKDGSDLGRMFDFLGDPVEDFNFKEGSDEVKFDSDVVRPRNALSITKNRYSAFVGTELEKMLRRERVKRVVVCGFMTNFCCESTARDAHDRDLFVDFIVDATGTPGTQNLSEKKIRDIVAELLGEGCARIFATSEALKADYVE